MEMEVFNIKDDIQADKMITDIHELESEKNRFEMIYNARVDQLKENLAKEVGTIDREVNFKKGMLQAYFLTIKPSETKTQKTYKLLSGKLVLKKPSVKIEIANKENLMQYARTSAAEYIKVKEDIDWAAMKKVLDIDGTNVVNTETGEILGELEGLAVKEVKEIFDIK